MAESPNHQWCFIEIHAADVERCKSFYGECFGWTFEDVPEMNYTFYATAEGGMGGGIAVKGEQSPPHLVNYVQVASIDDSLERVRNRGGSVVVPKTDFSGAGWLALVNDPEGNLFGLWETAGAPATD